MMTVIRIAAAAIASAVVDPQTAPVRFPFDLAKHRYSIH